MHRIQVQLTPAQEAQLREMARARSVSISFLILLAPANDDLERRWAAALAVMPHYPLNPIPPAVDLSDEYADALYEEMMENRP